MAQQKTETLFACIDPNWGEPRIVRSTIRETAEEAQKAAINDPELSLYSGGAFHCIPPRPGKWESLARNHYKIARISAQIEEFIPV